MFVAGGQLTSKASMVLAMNYGVLRLPALVNTE
jgi:hypothetical protein